LFFLYLAHHTLERVGQLTVQGAYLSLVQDQPFPNSLSSGILVSTGVENSTMSDWDRESLRKETYSKREEKNFT
jgi:hypothetical protein